MEIHNDAVELEHTQSAEWARIPYSNDKIRVFMDSSLVPVPYPEVLVVSIMAPESKCTKISIDT